ncbi:MAG: TetR/AcrR family transcriptional regulator [Candidatus Nanopelagicales bacterium]
MSIAEPARRGVRLPRQARREQLLASAQEIFVTRGYHAAAMDEIAVKAGVSKPVLYQHFPSKLDLYLALLEQSSQDLVERVQQALDGTPDNHLRVRAAIDAYFAFVDDKSAAFRLIFESDLTNEPAVGAIVEGTDFRCATAVSHVISADTGLPEDQAMLVATGLTGMAQTAARYWLRQQGRIPRDQASQIMSVLAWRGVSGFPKTDARH